MEQAFKFYFLNEQGQANSFLRKKGMLSDTELVLDKEVIPVGKIGEVAIRDKNLVVAVMDEPPKFHVIQTSKAKSLNSRLGLLRSSVWADKRQKELAETGESHRFRKDQCPACSATLDLTDMEATPQVYCEYCSTISTKSNAGTDIEKGYGICEECGMYSRPRKFTIFYFYFLLVVYGFSSRPTWRCPGCMRGEAWKMLFGNLLFVIGIPVALVQLFRSYGGTDVASKYRGLDGANLKAKSGKMEAAISAYQGILQQQPIAAGVKHNLALAFASNNRFEEAAKMFEFALRDCSNYEPSASLLAACYGELGRTDELEALKKQWGAEDGDTGHES